MMDCSNQGACRGGVTTSGFIFVEMNKGIDSEKEYNYTASDAKQCWKAGAARHVASIDSHKSVPPKNEEQLAAAVSAAAFLFVCLSVCLAASCVSVV